MNQAQTSHVLLDFFGTLVDYSASRTDQGFEQSHALVRTWGSRMTYQQFLTAWSRASATFDRLSDIDDHEFSMEDVGTAFLAEALHSEPTRSDVEAFVAEYVREWNKGVRYLQGIGDLLHDLAADYRLAVVTNTHHATLVPSHLEAMGVLPLFDAVITSVEVGWRKPHEKIFSAALDALGTQASAAAFVGDTYHADFEGPERAGITAYLIDPQGRTAVPPARRLTSIFDLPGRLRAD